MQRMVNEYEAAVYKRRIEIRKRLRDSPFVAWPHVRLALQAECFVMGHKYYSWDSATLDQPVVSGMQCIYCGAKHE